MGDMCENCMMTKPCINKTFTEIKLNLSDLVSGCPKFAQFIVPKTH